MPDSAVLHTERQFAGLLAAASGPLEVEMRGFALPSLIRSPEMAGYVARKYSPLSELARFEPDVVVVTGSEPLSPSLADETYFAELVGLVEWSVAHASSLVLSCLAAHAALLALDGIERSRLPEKATGVFAQRVAGAHALTAGIARDVVLPHSRLNDVASSAVEDAGYEVLAGSEEIGWGVAARTVGHCELVLLQGHPEYDASSLIREYRRDVDRFLAGASTALPVLPVACVAPADSAALERFHERIVEGDRSLHGALPFDDLAKRAPWPWRATATKLFTNWLAVSLERSGISMPAAGAGGPRPDPQE